MLKPYLQDQASNLTDFALFNPRAGDQTDSDYQKRPTTKAKGAQSTKPANRMIAHQQVVGPIRVIPPLNL
jgi:hypothetical protein